MDYLFNRHTMDWIKIVPNWFGTNFFLILLEQSIIYHYIYFNINKKTK